MKTLKFIGNDELKKQFAKSLRTNVHTYFKENGLSTKGNYQMFLKTIVMLSLYFVPFILILTITMSPWVALLLMPIMGIGKAGIGMGVMHDGLHGSYSHKNWVNRLMGSSMYFLGSNVLNWEVSHNVLHHTYTNVEGYDGDIQSRGVIRFSRHAPLKPVHKYQYIHAFFLYGFVTLFKMLRDFFQLFEFTRNGIMEKHGGHPVLEIITLFISKAVYLLVILGLPMLLTPFTWWQVLIGFLAMHFVAGIILGTVFQLAHVVEDAVQPLEKSEGIIENEWLVHELETTVNFAHRNKWLSWYIGGLNFQIEHHLFPNICHIHYPKIAPIVEKTAREYGFAYNYMPTFRAAVVSHMQTLKELGEA